MRKKRVRSIASRIKGAMIGCSLIFIGGLGAISLVLITANNNSILESNMTETAKLASDLVSSEIEDMKAITYELGCNPMLASKTVSNEKKLEILFNKVEKYEYTSAGLTMEDNIDIVSGWDCTDQDTVVQALEGNVYFSEPKIKNGGKLCSYFSAPLWKNGMADTKIIGSVIFMSNDYFLQDMIKDISISEHSKAFLLDQHGNIIADSSQETILEIINVEKQAKKDSNYKSVSKICKKMVQGETGFGEYVKDEEEYYVAYAPIEGTDGWSLAVCAQKNDFKEMYDFSIIALVVIVILSIVICMIVAGVIAKRIARPIHNCAKRMKTLAEGDLHTKVEIDDSVKEAKVLTTATSNLVDELNTLIGDIGYVLNKLSLGDFTVKSKCEERYLGDLTSIVNSMDSLKRKLRGTLSGIQESANRVMVGSNEMAKSSGDLADGASNQAESIKSLRNTIINVTEGVENNAKQTKESLDKMEDVKQATIDSTNEMEKMTEAMKRISETSKEIENIAAEIESISFQTNLLSVNASIEAARAGEAGKGFAVVAEEVRNLAVNSAKSAVNTKELIDAAILEIENGNAITMKTAEALTRVVEGLDMMRESTIKSAESYEEHALAMKKVENEIQQITDVVARNSATAEESSATCDELLLQATNLNELIEEFTI